MFLRDPVDVLRERLSLLDRTEEFLFRPLDRKFLADNTSFLYSTLQTTRSRDIYRSLQPPVFSCQDENVIWNDSVSST